MVWYYLLVKLRYLFIWFQLLESLYIILRIHWPGKCEPTHLSSSEVIWRYLLGLLLQCERGLRKGVQILHRSHLPLCFINYCLMYFHCWWVARLLLHVLLHSNWGHWVYLEIFILRTILNTHHWNWEYICRKLESHLLWIVRKCWCDRSRLRLDW